MLITVSERHSVDRQTDLGWRDLTIVCEIGTVCATITDDGEHMENFRIDKIPDELWDQIIRACKDLP